MNNQAINNLPWVDILPPAPPGEMIAWWVWLFIGVILFSISLVGFRWYISPKQSALRELKQIRQCLKNNNDIGHLPLKISHALRTGFNVNNINDIKVTDPWRWLDYKQQLLELCFSQMHLNKDTLESLLYETCYWIKNQAGNRE